MLRSRNNSKNNNNSMKKQSTQSTKSTKSTKSFNTVKKDDILFGSNNINIYDTILDDESVDTDASIEKKIDVKDDMKLGDSHTGPKVIQEQGKDGEWKVFNKKQKPKRYNRYNTNKQYEKDDKEVLDDLNKIQIVEQKLDPNDIGTDYKFNGKWVVWSHLIDSTDWSPESYINAYEIVDLSSFWQFFNNSDKIDFDKYQFYIMREHSQPRWEHESNCNGGTCSLRITKAKANELIEQLAILVLNESFSDNPSDINGLSFGAKQSWCIVKVWNQNSNNDTSVHVPQYMIKRYNTHPRYKKNELDPKYISQ
jgi:ferredoxin